MNLVIPLPPKVSEEAHKIAAELDISLADLFVIAFYQYWSAYKRENITAALNEIYEQEASSLDPQLHQLQSDSLESDKW